MEWGGASLQFEGTRCGHLRSPARCGTEEADRRPTSRKKIDGRLTRFFSRKVLGEFLSQPYRQNINFTVQKKKKELAAYLSMKLSGHHDTVEFWVHFFSTQKKVCSTVFGQIGPKVTYQKSVKTSKKKCSAAFSANAFACKSRQ